MRLQHADNIRYTCHKQILSLFSQLFILRDRISREYMSCIGISTVSLLNCNGLGQLASEETCMHWMPSKPDILMPCESRAGERSPLLVARLSVPPFRFHRRAKESGLRLLPQTRRTRLALAETPHKRKKSIDNNNNFFYIGYSIHAVERIQSRPLLSQPNWSFAEQHTQMTRTYKNCTFINNQLYIHTP